MPNIKVLETHMQSDFKPSLLSRRYPNYEGTVWYLPQAVHGAAFEVLTGDVMLQ
jgi:hypothetical protein